MSALSLASTRARSSQQAARMTFAATCQQLRSGIAVTWRALKRCLRFDVGCTPLRSSANTKFPSDGAGSTLMAASRAACAYSPSALGAATSGSSLGPRMRMTRSCANPACGRGSRRYCGVLHACAALSAPSSRGRLYFAPGLACRLLVGRRASVALGTANIGRDVPNPHVS
jgi:hypothetical protein